METAINSKVQQNFLPPPFLPYDYQVPIIKDMVQTIVDRKSGLVIQPTATGKSVEAAFAARACILLHGMKGLYLYNENEGLEQAHNKFLEVFAGNPIKCADFFGYGKDEFVHDADMVFASFQSLNSHHGKWYNTFDQNHFGFVIVNEAHHSQAETYKEVIEYFVRGKIGMTATEKRMDGKDIRDLFPHIICEIHLEEAIVKRQVAEVEYHVLSSGLSTQRLKQICHEVLEKGKRISIKQLNENIFVEMLDKELLAEVYKYAFPNNEKTRQTLIFCENIDHARHVLRLLQEDGKSVEAIHSKQSDFRNRLAMKEFRNGDLQFLLSVDKLNEDIDVPDAEVGVFLRATDSENVFTQQMGRLLRRTKVKTKAIILDFVANLDRLVMLQKLVGRINTLSGKDNPEELQRDLMHVLGEGFEFSFSDDLRSVLSLLRLIRKGLYQKWEEASAVAVEAGIKASGEYYRKCMKIDLRLPTCPNVYYSNFPGWNVFLQREVAPKGWVQFNNIKNNDDFKHSYKSIEKFLSTQENSKPKLFGNYWNMDGKNSSLYIHPKLFRKIKKEFGGRKPAPGEWMSNSALSRKNRTSANMLQRFVEDYRNDHPGWFKFYLSKSAYVEHYHPKLVKIILEKFKIASQATIPEGWLTATMFVAGHTDLSLKMVEKIADEYRKEHSNWFINPTIRIGLKLISVECYHPDLIAAIELQTDRALLAPEGWVTINPNRFSSDKTAREIAEKYRADHPEWFHMYCVNAEYREHIHPDLANVISDELAKVRTDAPTGWDTAYKIALGYPPGIKWTRIQKEAQKHRAEHPEWFKFFKAGDSHIPREHYHPYLIALIHSEVVNVLPPPEGWTTISLFVKKREIPQSSKVWKEAKEFVEKFKSTHPEWYGKYLSHNHYIEHYHPDLLKMLKEEFAKKK